MNGIVVETENLCIGYRLAKGQRRVVSEGISVSLREREVVCLIGPNGAGKSTLMRTIAGLQPGLAGKVAIEGKDLAECQPQELARSIGIVLTERVNVGMLSSFALVSLGRHPYTGWTGRLSDEDVRVIHWALEAAGASDLTARFVGELSDGERQKVMIARALAQEPHTIILDEPTAFLDLPRRVETMGLLRSLARDTGRSILLSTHDLDLALRSADRIWLMPLGQPLQEGAPEDLVLTGILERAFANEGVEFDRLHGSFVMARRSDETIGLRGNGITAVWTRRALEREGFQVAEASEGGDPPFVEIKESGMSVSWTAVTGAGESAHSSIYELISHLRREIHDRPVGGKGGPS